MEPGKNSGGSEAAADSVDLASFLHARQKDIQTLHAHIKASKDGKTERAFQALPRSMRRRTASHNAKRLPQRLRQRARRDQASDNTPSVSVALDKRKKARAAGAWVHENIKKRTRLQQEKKLAARLRRKATEGRGVGGVGGDTKMGEAGDDPTDEGEENTTAAAPLQPNTLLPVHELKLPTHMWASKRAQMGRPGPAWNAVLVKTPADKTYRATMRTAGLAPGQCICWDTSYQGVVCLQGPAAQVRQALSAVVEPHLLSAAVQSGRCCVDAKLPRAFGYQTHPDDAGEHGHGHGRGGPGHCGAMTVFYNPTGDDDNDDGDGDDGELRQAFLRVHPTLFTNVWNTLAAAVAQQQLPVTLYDFRLEVGGIELTGSGAMDALLATLVPHQQQPQQAGADVEIEPQASDFLRLRYMDAPTALSAAGGTMLAFEVQDPRLDYDDVPKVPARLSPRGDRVQTSLDRLANWPSTPRGRPSGLFDDARRQRAGWLQTQATLDKRRGKLAPGQKLRASVNNHPIPVILAVSKGSHASHGGALAHAVSPTWTLLAPRRCIDVIWRRLMHSTLPRGGRRPLFGGYDEHYQLSVERGQPWFPADFPGTPAGRDWERQSRQRELDAWKRKPPSKRTNWDTFQGEAGSPFGCDWELLFRKGAGGDREDSREDAAMERGMQHVSWPDVRRAVAHLRLPSPLQPWTWRADGLLLTISVRMAQRGVPHGRARIYRLPSRKQLAAEGGAAAGCSAAARWLALADSVANAKKKRRAEDGVEAAAATAMSTATKAAEAATAMSMATKAAVKKTLRRLPASADEATRKRLIAQSLLQTRLPYPRPDTFEDMPMPPAADLIGYITSGAFNQQGGIGWGIGHVCAQRLAEALAEAEAEAAEAKGSETNGNEDERSSWLPRLCIVRNVGEKVARLAYWSALSH